MKFFEFAARKENTALQYKGGKELAALVVLIGVIYHEGWWFAGLVIGSLIIGTAYNFILVWGKWWALFGRHQRQHA